MKIRTFIHLKALATKVLYSGLINCVLPYKVLPCFGILLVNQLAVGNVKVAAQAVAGQGVSGTKVITPKGALLDTWAVTR